MPANNLYQLTTHPKPLFADHATWCNERRERWHMRSIIYLTDLRIALQ